MDKTIAKSKSSKNNVTALMGAAFIMATSAIGPGFLTQTATFTNQYRTNFGFVVLITTIFFIGAQLNVWRVIGVSGLRGQDIANRVLPGLGYFIAILVGIGGLAFNIGNVGGAALGVNVMFNADVTISTIACGLISIAIFLIKESGPVIDKLTRLLAIVVIIVVGYVAVINKPDIVLVAKGTFIPENPSNLIFPIITLLGGSVGGYITFAGGHRLIDAGITGEENLKDITKSSILGISVATIVRIFLFLAIFAVVSKGLTLDPENPAASAFKYGAGNIGYKFFGLVLWCASITSVIGAAYTSVSFIKTLHPFIENHENKFIILFIFASTLIMALVGKPASLLVLAGSLNGLILPITLGVILIASKKESIVGNYKHPKWLLILGIIVVIVTAVGGIISLKDITKLFV
ncbi:NRAMP family divalent metal transporter [Clostridium sp. CCUG 7971]|uniref:NRAMP family divalent metal transporter n=1 Tax=Clostridium sp. CCUG 7971 TaxID=2811414 RepID=UPI002570CB33|nr:NRAMP family divalent metal transporter [Clostridium sp. CCUG 7971]